MRLQGRSAAISSCYPGLSQEAGRVRDEIRPPGPAKMCGRYFSKLTGALEPGSSSWATLVRAGRATVLVARPRLAEEAEARCRPIRLSR